RVGGQQRGPRHNQFRFLAQHGHGTGKAVPDTGDPNNFGGKSWRVDLKPGEVFTKTVDLGRWFTFDDPDTYRITGMYSFEVHEPDRYQAIWDDLAVGQCFVRVVAKNR